MQKSVFYIVLFMFAVLTVGSFSAGAGTTLYIKKKTDGTIAEPAKPFTKSRGVTIVQPEGTADNSIKTGLYVKAPLQQNNGHVLSLPPVPAKDYRAAIAAFESQGMSGCSQQEIMELRDLERQIAGINTQLAREDYTNEGVITNPKNGERVNKLYMKCGRVVAGR